MGKWTKTAGLLFLAAASVYSSQVIVAAAGRGATPRTVASASSPAASAAPAETALPAPAAPRIFAAPNTPTDVKVLEEGSDPFANATSTTQPAAPVAAVPTTQPGEGRSVSSSEVSVSDAGTVEIHVNDANLVEVLRMLSLQSQKNIVASKEVHGTVTANLYDVTVREALDAILHANGYAYREKGNFIYVYTTKEIAEIEKAEKVMKSEVFRVYYTTAADAAIMMKPVLSSGGQVAVTAPAKVGISSAPAGGGGNDYANNDVLVVTDYPENIDAVRKLLADVDKRPQQILLEATILRATLNEDNALGVDFNIMGGVDMAGILGSVNQITNSGVPAPVDPAAPPAAGEPLGPGAILPPGNVNSVGTGNAFTAPIQGGLKVGVVTNSVSVFLSAIEQTTDTAILANPKVLALNKQQGEVFVGNEDGYYTTLTTETTTSQSVESLKTGTRLIFRPFIGNDGYIRMEVHPEDSDGQVKANGLPSKSTTEVTSNIMVKDGHTIVIGGLFRESSISGRSQVPFLGNLPVAGLLFRNQRDRTVREEVIILLTPHIVKDDVAYSKLSEEALKHAEDLRVGTRKGMMPWGRERLAQGWYEAARKEMAKPRPNRGLAKWQLDCATNLNPQFTDAIELKEEITGHVVTLADGSAIRSFVKRSIVTDVAPATQPVEPAAQPITDATTQPSITARADDPNKEESDLNEKDLAPAIPGTEEASTNEDSIALPPAPKVEATAPADEPAATQPVTPTASSTSTESVDHVFEPASEAGEIDSGMAEAGESESTQAGSATSESTESATASEPKAGETDIPVTVVAPLEESEEPVSAATAESATTTDVADATSQPATESTVTVVPLDEAPAGQE